MSSSGRYQMLISDELFYYYHVAHMAKHFINGGCGIRTFMDVWILNHRVDHDRKKRETLLSEGGLLAFAQAVEKLAEIWFSNLEMDAFSSLLAEYILDGGTYGALKNRVSVSQVKKGGKLQYAWSRVFLPYDVIKYHYPVLQERKDLLPLYQVVRWLKLLFKGGVKRSLRELQANANVSQEEIMTSKNLLKHLDLE